MLIFIATAPRNDAIPSAAAPAPTHVTTSWAGLLSRLVSPERAMKPVMVSPTTVAHASPDIRRIERAAFGPFTGLGSPTCKGFRTAIATIRPTATSVRAIPKPSMVHIVENSDSPATNPMMNVHRPVTASAAHKRSALTRLACTPSISSACSVVRPEVALRYAVTSKNVPSGKWRSRSTSSGFRNFSSQAVPG